ncbi:peptide ABC transporter substrate-binding protein [Clostridium bowmanii]|uniref:peptide ABC transporter substrate-binding protein n=1 Tax=Clostridium bowmanii TaxID=132925 RepID=UPI001C0CA26D|nr:peptide ABC transporter substrate-binding protein [Clostridium bowmanii]MBU3191734.1 peptide ABC transporter substrate-binding protein [Clostridium bowmanii]MCA1076047.1 peptide ABC transporter substrate-binding protein [Clostridium bowmanii]
MKKGISLMLTAMLSISMLSGCKKADTKTSTTEVKQEYSTVYSGELTTLNYLVTASENEFAAAANLVDCLVDYDKYGVVKPSLAKDWSVSSDGLIWTFNLREGVKWVTNDGKEYAQVEAQDFVDSMKYVLDKKNNSETANIAYSALKNGEKYYKGEVKDFSEVGVKAKSKYVLEYTLESIKPYFLSMLTYVCFMPINGKFLGEVGAKFGTDNKNLLYNGAYLLQTFEPQNSRVFVANENYWDKENVFIKKLTYSYNKEATTLSPELFSRGQITDAIIPTSSIDEWMKDVTKKETVRPIATTFYSYFYAFNFQPKFDAKYEPKNWKLAVNNSNFRKSLFSALDKKAAMMTAEPYEPERRLSNTITPKNFIDIKGVDYTALGTLAATSAKSNFDSVKAKDFKTKAMEELKGKVTFPVKIVMPYSTASSDWTNRAQVIEQQMEKLLGADYIDIIILPYPPTGFLNATRRAGNYSLMECNWGPDYADPQTYTDPFTSESNYGFINLATEYKDASGKGKYENMVNAAKAEVLNTEKRYKLFSEAEQFLIDEALVIPYSLGGGGFIATRLEPFTSPYSPFGVSANKFKGQKIMDKAMNTETYKSGFETWQTGRATALKVAATAK